MTSYWTQPSFSPRGQNLLIRGSTLFRFEQPDRGACLFSKCEVPSHQRMPHVWQSQQERDSYQPLNCRSIIKMLFLQILSHKARRSPLISDAIHKMVVVVLPVLFIRSKGKPPRERYLLSVFCGSITRIYANASCKFWATRLSVLHS